MSIFLIVLFIIECFSFCYLFYKVLEIGKDVEVLFDNYSNFIEKSLKSNVMERRNVLK